MRKMKAIVSSKVLSKTLEEALDYPITAVNFQDGIMTFLSSEKDIELLYEGTKFNENFTFIPKQWRSLCKALKHVQEQPIVLTIDDNNWINVTLIF